MLGYVCVGVCIETENCAGYVCVGVCIEAENCAGVCMCWGM